jgi:Cu-Zn family superoxide dismutase
MNRKLLLSAAAAGLFCIGFAGAGCHNEGSSSSSSSSSPSSANETSEQPHHHAMAIAHVQPAKNAPQDEQVSGTVKFMPSDDGVMAMLDLKGFKPNSEHGFHIHEKGDLSAPDLKSAGGHFDPGMTKHHGGTTGDMRHGGDLGNITADASGNVKTDITVHGISIDGATDGIVGRSVIVHAKADDLKSQPAGDAGDRIAGGVIETAKHAHEDKSEK